MQSRPIEGWHDWGIQAAAVEAGAEGRTSLRDRVSKRR